MPSTFSPNLRLELIGAGEQAGTWGTTTNTNFGTLVESAISGYVAVSISSANQALTAVNGAADQARNAMIQLNSATAPFAVYAPPESKQYVVFNNTAHVATIFNSTALGNTTPAGTGIAIPAGRTVSVWSDDTNFRVQNNLIVGDVVGNVTGNVTGNLNGNLTAAAPTAPTQAFGNNTTIIATTAFVQAALQALHPVGSVYMNATNAANPSSYFGFGTWVAFGAGRVPVGFNAADPLFDTAEETGGSKDATLPSHTHTATSAITDPGHFHNYPKGGASSGPRHAVSIDTSVNTAFDASTDLTSSRGTDIRTTGVTVATTVNSTGTSATNANLQPYITVYIWKRTA